MPKSSSNTKRILILGSTGSIGTQTLDVISHLNAAHERNQHPFKYIVVGLATGSNSNDLLKQAQRFNVTQLAIADPQANLPDARRGPDAAEQLVRETDCDIVVAAIVGAAGIPATLAALKKGRHVALANKETLIAAGALVVPAAIRTGAHILPIDSEHSAIWQCLTPTGPSQTIRGTLTAPPISAPTTVRRILLTASGGPFRTWTKDQIYNATPEQALNHPTWSMGEKVTIDSASLMNKALEIIEAHWLFGLSADKIDVIVHPQSIVHAIVEYTDGSMIAQMGAPDMRTPIQHALTFPDRADAPAPRLTIEQLSKLNFEPPDPIRFPSLTLAHKVINRGGTSGAIFNAANEVAVQAFLNHQIPFGNIPELVADALESIPTQQVNRLADVLQADSAARAHVNNLLIQLS